MTIKKYHTVYPGDEIEYYDLTDNEGYPNIPYARCKILEIIENGEGVKLQWFKDDYKPGHRTYNPHIINLQILTYKTFKVIHDRTDKRLVIHRNSNYLDDDLFIL